jgi:hypothetical protein
VTTRTDPGDHDADVGDHDRPIRLPTMLRSTCPRWAETRTLPHGGFRDYARDVPRLSYAISAILPQNARSWRIAERSGERAGGQMDEVGLTWHRYVWPLATGGESPLQPASTT